MKRARFAGFHRVSTGFCQPIVNRAIRRRTEREGPERQPQSGRASGGAQPGSFNVFTCSIGGAFYPNRAWTSGNNPTGNPASQTDT
jgi:hypothetical protein